MAILINERTPIVVQGFTGKIGTFHAQDMINYGSNVVGGITPGKGGSQHLGRPVFNTVKESVEQLGAEASIVFVPPAFAADSIMEAAEAGIKYCVAITDGIPTQDMMKVKNYLKNFPEAERMVLTGPNCAGTISPGRAMLGIMPGHIYIPGVVGVVGRSGTLGYEAADQMKALGVGISTSVGIGGDPINGSSHSKILAKFEQDTETKVVLMIGEIGGQLEADAARWIKENGTKPVVGFIAGQTAPKGRTMGHAGAIVGGSDDTAEAKMRILRECGVNVVESPAQIGAKIAELLGVKNL